MAAAQSFLTANLYDQRSIERERLDRSASDRRVAEKEFAHENRPLPNGCIRHRRAARLQRTRKRFDVARIGG